MNYPVIQGGTKRLALGTSLMGGGVKASVEIRGVSSYHCVSTSILMSIGPVPQCLSEPRMLSLASPCPITAPIILGIDECDYTHSNSLITHEYQLCPCSVSICLFTNHPRGAMRERERGSSQPGIQHSRCGLVSATNSESLSPALFSSH